MFIASPMRGPPPPATSTSPVVIPTRASSGIGAPSRRRASRSWTSSPARTARRASSSWISGTPNTAHTASPMNFSTRPPCRSTASRASAKYRSSRGRSTSGSWRSPSDVDPTRSQNSTVTTFRASWAAAVGPSFAPAVRAEGGVRGAAPAAGRTDQRRHCRPAPESQLPLHRPSIEASGGCRGSPPTPSVAGEPGMPPATLTDASY